MLRKLSALVAFFILTIFTTLAQTPSNNEIWYTTTDGKTLSRSFDTDDLVSNSYNNGRGVLKFRNSVTSIEDCAFYGCSSLTSITIPNSVTRIEDGAFYGCSSLTSITIPNSITSIGHYAFEGCNGLKSFKGKYASIDGRCFIKDGELIAYAPAGLTSYTIPNSVTEIGGGAFYDCSSLTSITIPNSVTSIGNSAFAGCSSLTSITIGNGVTSIGWSAFRDCSSLTSITIPDSVTSIGEYAFVDCSSLTSITISNSVTSIGYSAFRGCSSLTSITIPNSVTSIGDDAFYGCSSLKSVKGKYASSDGRCLIIDGKLIAYAPAELTSYTIPDSVTEIGGGAFQGCSSLKSITIPNSVTEIGNSAFYGCSSLTSITIPNNVTSIGKVAFYGCSSLKSFKGKYASSDGRCLIIDGKLIAFAPSGLTSYTIPDSVTSIEYGAFAGCSSLTSITIPNSVTEFGNSAFYGCSSLKSFKGKFASEDGRCLIKDGELIAFAPAVLTSYTIPNSVTSIGYSAFSGCISLTSITIPNSITSIGHYAFEGCSSLTSITIPDSVTSIEYGAFAGCSSLTSINIPNSVTSIEYRVFAGCRSLTSVTIPNSVTTIVGGAFWDCSSLTSITIGNGVTSIEYEAFSGYSSLKSVKVSNKYCYDYFKKLGVSDITFAVSTLEEYQEAHKLGATKLAIDSNSKYASEDGLCLIDNGKLILFIGKNLTEYTIPESVTSFREKAFDGCNGLKSVKVANKYCYDYFKDKVADIAFYGANASADGRCLIVNGELQRFIGKGITQFSIPESVTSFREKAFDGCSDLKSVKVANKYCYDYFKDKVADIAFYGANASADGRCLIVNGELQRFIGKGVTQFSIPEGVTSVGDNAFRNYNRLTSITIPDSVAEIGRGAFKGCSSLTSITIPESVTSIGYETFSDCSNLTVINCMASTPPAISDLCIPSEVIIYVPKGAIKAYKKDENWMQYKKQIKLIK